MSTLTTTADAEIKVETEKNEGVLSQIEAEARKIGAKIKNWIASLESDSSTVRPAPYIEESFFRNGFCGRLLV
ncbi:MAG TPA: hypothetical protein VJB59_10345 [Bdellovibrionota bacterium]|nr:hypothetical protein [Bdellovibrionota bacterium]